MRIACLQFSPQLGAVAENIARANALLEASPPTDLDLLVLPEMAFTGYSFPSFASIKPHLELLGAGPTYHWAKATAARLQCIVVVGYPQLASPPPNPICYNSTITVSPTGAILATYNKTHLYYTDETWAQESPSGWLTCSLPLPRQDEPPTASLRPEGKGVKASFGICMDINPYRFAAPWSSYEFATAALRAGTEILLLSMAWLAPPPLPSSSSPTAAAATEAPRTDPKEPDSQTWAYWCARLQPLIEQRDRDIIVVVACRSGEEGQRSGEEGQRSGEEGQRSGAEAERSCAEAARGCAGGERSRAEAERSGNEPAGDAPVRYAGTSWVGRIGRGTIAVWGVLGRGEEAILGVDTAGGGRGMAVDTAGGGRGIAGLS